MRKQLHHFSGLTSLVLAAFFLALNAHALDRAVLGRMDTQINAAISEKKLPGAVIWVEQAGDIYHKAFGDRAVDPKYEEMTRDTIFDSASLTKVVAALPSIMILIERGQVKLDEKVSTYISELKGTDKEAITVKQILTHVSGLPSGTSHTPKWEGNDAIIKKIAAEKMEKPGEKVVYSDLNFVLVGEIVRRVSKMPLNEFAAKEIFQPLKMSDTSYLPSKEKASRIAPTEKLSGEYMRGVVHDPTARYMGGVSGNAGLFTTAADLARYARMILNGGELDGARIFKPETIKLMTSVQTPEGNPSRRGLGWDIDSAFSRPRGEKFPLGSFGHTGFTGNAIWIDPFSKTFFVFLSNRVHPNGKGNVLDLYKSLGTTAADAVTDFDFAYVPDALPPQITGKQAAPKNELNNRVPGVLNGIDVLEKQKFAPLKGMKVGLITNHTGKNRLRYPTIDLLLTAPDVELKVLFAPEHGLYGLLDEAIADSVDERTGLPVYSLYGKNRAPTADQMRGLDALVFDIQDVGCRFYTYISTMGLAMEAAGKHGLKFFVLDRVNPIRGDVMDGPMLRGKSSFVGYHDIPLRHGMTVGELAHMFKAERKFNTDLTVIKMEGWSRSQWFDETAQPWGYLSPNMRNLTQAALYAGVGVLEYCGVSVGRGTDAPFEVLGAPYIHDIKLAYELNKIGLKGVRFVPIRFTPKSSVFANQSCAGVGIVLTDRENCDVVDIGISIGKILHRWYPEQFNFKRANLLWINKDVYEAIRADKPLEEIKALYTKDVQDFAKRREPFLLYK